MTPAERRFEQLVKTCGGRVLSYLARRTTPVEEAADVYQETLTTAWRKVHDCPDDAYHQVAWLLSIARRTLANHRRARGRRLAATQRLHDELGAGLQAGRLVGANPADDLDHVRDAVAALGGDDREVLLLTYWEGLTCEQSALVLGVRPATARKRLERARRRVAAALVGGAHPASLRGAQSDVTGKALV
jgi:RNA polymerase sigma factor (sigma-70 family)